MFGIGMTEMVVIAVIALVVLGPKRLPELARTLGRTLGEFRRSATDLRREFSDVMDEKRIDPPAPPPAKTGPEPFSDAPREPAGDPPDAQAPPGESRSGTTGSGGASDG
jgi:sec-independent protein translocase protein TatB